MEDLKCKTEKIRERSRKRRKQFLIIPLQLEALMQKKAAENLGKKGTHGKDDKKKGRRK